MLVASLALSGLGVPAQAADARLEKAQQQRVQAQRELDKLVGRLSTLEAEVAQVENRLAELAAAERRAQEQAAGASAALRLRVRESYKRGTGDPMLALFTSESPQQAAAQARLLGLLAKRSRSDFESATAARIRTQATALDVERVAADLRSRQARLDAVRAQVAGLLAKAQQRERHVRDRIAKEQAAKRRVARRTTRQSGTRAAEGAAAVVNGAACPVGNPRSYSDTWGAPRSGGRRHKGTDILAPRGTGIYAYESGSITRLTNSRVGGISIYMRGASGNTYYYTHLQGYVSGLSAGQAVNAGEHIAFNGDTGNAQGTPHLHFEVMPGGGGNVNPYPYVKRACG
ncbi:MAG TPA: M23 family metallopeptidase [Egibacteraceae bacterium]|nr:M23 family metallopeptidase [Egibacteraceae bacterium]